MCCLLATGKKRLTDFVSFPVLKNGVRRAYCIVLDICFICPFGANKKYKAHISKYVRHILKYLRRIFCLLKTGENNADKNDGHCGVLMSEKTVQKMPLMIFVHKRHS